MRIEGRAYWRCGACLATFLEPASLPSKATEEAQYRLHRNTVDDPAYRGFLSRLMVPLVERLPAHRHGLDFGCGPGPALAAMLREAGHHMAVYDPFFQPDPAPLARTYDFITCSEVVEHFHRPAVEFARLDDLLRPGGFLAIMTSFQTDDDGFSTWHYHRDPTHVVFYRADTFRWIAARYGWQCDIPSPNVALLQKPDALVADRVPS